MLRRRNDFGLPESGGRRRKGDASEAVGPHRLEHVESGQRILLEVPPRRIEPTPNVRVGGEMKNERAPLHRGGQRLLVENVGLDQKEGRTSTGVLQKRGLPRREVVVGDHLVAFGEQAIDEIAADEPGAAGDEVSLAIASSHAALIPGRRCR